MGNGRLRVSERECVGTFIGYFYFFAFRFLLRLFFSNEDCESVYHVVTLFVFYASFHRVAVYFHTKSNKTKFKSFDKQWRRTNRKPVADITAID